MEVIRHHPLVTSELGASIVPVEGTTQYVAAPNRKTGSLGSYYLTIEGSRPLTPDSKKSKKARATVLLTIDQSRGVWAPVLARFTPHQTLVDGSEPKPIDLTESVSEGFALRVAETGGQNRSFGEFVLGAKPTAHAVSGHRSNVGDD